MTLLLLASLALADEPTAVVDGTTVRGTAHLAVAPGVVLDALADPAFESRIQQSRTTTTVTVREGACHQAAYVVPHPIMTARYELRRCRTDAGWDVSLVSSDSFHTYQGSWRAVPEGEGARLTFEVDLTSSIRWVPESIVRGEMRKSVRQLMAALAAWSEAQAAGG
ncbi:MAG: hypothetical protein H6732_20175 [Alphaproteobacteria bacterium]|nr:hypothetical protein [Alphaproteobacteria bacterium]